MRWQEIEQAILRHTLAYADVDGVGIDLSALHGALRSVAADIASDEIVDGLKRLHSTGRLALSKWDSQVGKGAKNPSLRARAC